MCNSNLVSLHRWEVLIIRLTDIIKSFMDVGEDAVHSRYLCHHVFHILDNAGVQTTRKKSSQEFYRQWRNKVLGLSGGRTGIEWGHSQQGVRKWTRS